MKVIVCGKWHNYLFRSKHSFQCIGKLRMKSYFITAVTILAALLLSSGGLLVTHAATTSSTNDYAHNNLSSQTLTMSITGGVASAGNQRYFIQQNGPALEAVVAGDPLVTSQLSYTLYANQQGLSTSGSAYFQLTGTGASGTSYKVFGSIQLSSSVAGACLPFLSATSASATFSGPCPSSYTSEVPAAFTGLGMVQIINTTSTTSSGSGNNNGNGNSNGYGNGFGTGDNGNGYGKDQSHFDSNNNPSKTVREAMAFENAYFNPFGDAITITSTFSILGVVRLSRKRYATCDTSWIQFLLVLSQRIRASKTFRYSLAFTILSFGANERIIGSESSCLLLLRLNSPASPIEATISHSGEEVISSSPGSLKLVLSITRVPIFEKSLARDFHPLPTCEPIMIVILVGLMIALSSVLFVSCFELDKSGHFVVHR